jgi:hypothetical protein
VAVLFALLWLSEDVPALLSGSRPKRVLVLTGTPILITPVVQAVRGETAAWAVTVPIGVLTAGLIGLRVWLLRGMRLGDVR